MQTAVHRMAPGLGWEFGPGLRTPHALSLSGEGDPKLRMLAERWRMKAPSPSTVFEYYATKQPIPEDRINDQNLKIGSIVVDFADFRGRADRPEGRAVLDIMLFHPSFENAPRSLAEQAALIALLQTIGEDGVERWVNSIDILAAAPPGGVDLTGLKHSFTRLADEIKNKGGWVVGQADENGHRLIYTLDTAVKRWDHPFKDTFCILKLAYPDRGDGLPTESDMAKVDALEEAVVDVLHHDAVHIGRRTGAGERLVFFYMQGSSPAPEALKAWARQCIPPALVELHEDPGWGLRP